MNKHTYTCITSKTKVHCNRWNWHLSSDFNWVRSLSWSPRHHLSHSPLITHHKNCCTTSPLTHPNTWTNSTWSTHPSSPSLTYLLTYTIFPFDAPTLLPTRTPFVSSWTDQQLSLCQQTKASTVEMSWVTPTPSAMWTLAQKLPLQWSGDTLYLTNDTLCHYN